jgi:hypothetical protein
MGARCGGWGRLEHASPLAIGRRRHHAGSPTGSGGGDGWSNGWNSLGPCRIAAYIRAAADSMASWAANAGTRIRRDTAAGQAGHPLGSLLHTDGA